MTNDYDAILKNSKAFYLTPEYIDIILYQKGLFKVFSDIEVLILFISLKKNYLKIGRIRLNLLDLMKKPNNVEWFNLKSKKDLQGSILIGYVFEKIQDIDLNPKNFKVTYCKMVGSLGLNINSNIFYYFLKKRTILKKNPINLLKIKLVFLLIIEFKRKIKEILSLSFISIEVFLFILISFIGFSGDQKSGCKTETSVLENEMIDERNNSSESQEEIQKKYDQMDRKEQKSLNDEWFENFDDLDENISNVTDSNSNEDSDSQNWNKFLYSSNREINFLDLIEIIREENDILKKKEQSIKESFETLKNDYSRIIKEKKNIENKKMRIFFVNIRIFKAHILCRITYERKLPKK